MKGGREKDRKRCGGRDGEGDRWREIRKEAPFIGAMTNYRENINNLQKS